jgi:hypothetical protein
MRPSRLVILAWGIIILVLVILEVAELTHFFTLPVTSAVTNLFSFIFAIVFITILALVGALFIGIYISQRLQSGSGFTPFEEEMLKMRADVKALREQVEDLQRRTGEAGAPADPPRIVP